MAPPTFQLDGDGARWWAEKSIDFGTGTLVMYGKILKDGVPIQPAIPLKLHGEEEDAAVVAWHNGNFYWGEALLQAVDDGKIPGHTVIRGLKLTMYEGFAIRGTSAIKDYAMDQLAAAGKTREETITVLFTSMMAEAKDVLCGTHLSHLVAHHGPNFLRNMPIRAQVTKPHSFGPHAGRILRDAAVAAGASRVGMASEQMAVFAAYMEMYPGEVPEWAREIFLLVDCGAGTVDSVKVQYVGGDGPECRWGLIAQSSGSVSGGDKINHYGLEDIDANLRGGGLQGLSDDLGMPLEDVRFQVLQGFEKAKKAFRHRFHLRKHDDYVVHSIMVDSSSGKQRSVDVTVRVIRDAADKVFTENRSDIDKLTKTDPAAKTGKLKYIVLCGGYGQFPYLKYQFENRYGKDGIKIVTIVTSGGAKLVAQGAVSSRYNLDDSSGLPLRFGFFVVQDELFSFKLHKDCWYLKTITGGPRTRKTPYDSKVSRQVLGADVNTGTVLARLRALNRKGKTAKDATPVVQVFQPFVDDPVVTLWLVCSELDGLEDHGPALRDDHDVSRHDNELRDGILPWAEPSWTLEKNVLKRHGWKKAPDSETGRSRYQNVYCRATLLHRNERDMRVRLELLLPSENGGAPIRNVNIPEDRDQYRDCQAVDVGIYQLWDSDHNEFLSDAEAGR